MPSFDSKRVADHVAPLSHRHRVAFCAAVSERLLPNYRRFFAEARWGNPDLLRRNLDIAWEWVLGRELPADEAERLALVCYDLAPEPGEFRSEVVSASLDAANAVAATLYCVNEASIERCVEVAEYARDTVDMYIQIRDDIGYHTPGLEERIVGDSLMVRELATQERQLQLLAASPHLDHGVVDQLRRGVVGTLEAAE
jgi:uncharacterized protein YjaG (DUF416 family)